MARVWLECLNSLPGIPLDVLSVPMENKYKCQRCFLVLRKPVQAQCGHRFCVHCFKQLTSSGPKPCEACRQEKIYEEPTSILNVGEAFPDNAAGREIASLPAKCLNEGCTWTGSIKEYETQHEACCDYELVQCEACNAHVFRSEKERHSERECEARVLNCKYCKLTFNFKDIKAHDEVCLKFPLQCKDCGKKKIPREKLSDHSRACVKSKSACSFSPVGCKFVTDNGKLNDHEHSSVMEHLRLLLPMVLSVARPNTEAQGSGEWQEDSGLGLYRAPEEGASSSMPSGDLEKKVSALENIVCVLNREVERSSVTLEAFSHQHRLDQEKIENLSNKMNQLERVLATRDFQLSETEQLVREIQWCTFDGVFVWKISDFPRRRLDAMRGQTPAMFSPAFYSSKYGYKMCLRLYLNGDGTGRGTHLSLFFVVMRGRHDALLKWPFSQKVTLMLLDQNNREHIIDAFRPDVTSTSFQRPTSEMNIASGCPLFCPLGKLADKSPYLRDDTIFIKAIVDLSGL
ncbi:TNF receptor-associated factor 2 [Entelurus aequoreus]|uniref:TNF receptor-associated factor 2 n=1 Tax=Entelurus aequoreus TaxID=161455 RepID=UPI002B1D6A73|nr:TNF receptor-associated factor 2 [Entelurus aequoreus]XP_061911286.1 TNF receptor-associated factor 2 [Entelurus aequoreus]XP_061911287.1 TNF receptor-associated factor 2 [Entelurus aequoreus]